MFIATLDGTTFKRKQFLKSNVPTNTVNEGKDVRNTAVPKPSKGLKQNFEWKIKKSENSIETPPNTVFLTISRKNVPLRKVVHKQPMVEYDFLDK